jgi:hypothetical protein
VSRADLTDRDPSSRVSVRVNGVGHFGRVQIVRLRLISGDCHSATGVTMVRKFEAALHWNADRFPGFIDPCPSGGFIELGHRPSSRTAFRPRPV